jgi:hypothetical protein
MADYQCPRCWTGLSFCFISAVTGNPNPPENIGASPGSAGGVGMWTLWRDLCCEGLGFVSCRGRVPVVDGGSLSRMW